MSSHEGNSLRRRDNSQATWPAFDLKDLFDLFKSIGGVGNQQRRPKKGQKEYYSTTVNLNSVYFSTRGRAVIQSEDHGALHVISNQTSQYKMHKNSLLLHLITLQTSAYRTLLFCKAFGGFFSQQLWLSIIWKQNERFERRGQANKKGFGVYPRLLPHQQRIAFVPARKPYQTGQVFTPRWKSRW